MKSWLPETETKSPRSSGNWIPFARVLSAKQPGSVCSRTTLTKGEENWLKLYCNSSHIRHSHLARNGDERLREAKLDLVFIGLTITSTWGNGHATTYRALLKELRKRGHRITFLERDVPWYSENREFSQLPYCEIGLYGSLDELRDRYADRVRQADFVIVGSYVPEGVAVGEWVTATARNGKAFYDIDTPVTLAALESDRCEYLSRALCQKYDLYLSFTGGPTLDYIEDQLRAPRARALYCSVDPTLYFPRERSQRWDIAYLGTYAADRQPALDEFLRSVAALHPEKRFAVAGPQYPKDIIWPENVLRIEHLPAYGTSRVLQFAGLYSESYSRRHEEGRLFS